MEKREKILIAKELCISFGGLLAVDHVSFGVAPGEILGLIGPNGAGKTTLLNLISGIYKADSGTLYFEGDNITDMPAHQRARLGIGRTFQTPRFLERSTIAENLLIGTDLADQMGFLKSFFGKKGYNFQEEFNELTERVGIYGKLGNDINAIPFGQKKRLEIVRAMLAHPKVLLVDEPAAGLNAKELEYVVSFLQHEAQEGRGIVLIEHQMDMVMNTCDRIIVLNFGKLIAEGTPREVASNEAVIEAYLGSEIRC